MLVLLLLLLLYAFSDKSSLLNLPGCMSTLTSCLVTVILEATVEVSLTSASLGSMLMPKLMLWLLRADLSLTGDENPVSALSELLSGLLLFPVLSPFFGEAAPLLSSPARARSVLDGLLSSLLLLLLSAAVVAASDDFASCF